VAGHDCRWRGLPERFGNAHDAPQGLQLLKRLEKPLHRLALVMDRACEDDETRQLAVDLGFTPVMPPKRNRAAPREYDRERCRHRSRRPRHSQPGARTVPG